MKSVAGKQALVTGAGSGIGAALCRTLAARGAQVLCTDVDGDAAERTASTLGGGARAARVDVTDAASVQAAVDDVVHRAGRLDLMFNNAGITWAADTENLTLEHWNSIIDINIRGVVHGVVAAYPQMIRQGGGFIVNTASMAGLVALPGAAAYNATKTAVVAISEGLFLELRGLGWAKTMISTRKLDQIRTDTTRSCFSTPAKRWVIISTIRASRMRKSRSAASASISSRSRRSNGEARSSLIIRRFSPKTTFGRWHATAAALLAAALSSDFRRCRRNCSGHISSKGSFRSIFWISTPPCRNAPEGSIIRA
mgnify:CR=1 FL=1